MNKIPLSKTKIETKLAIIREALSELQKIKVSNAATDFIHSKEQFAVAEHYLRRALEAIFDIANHIISRFPFSPGKRPTTYKDIALALGEKEIVDKKFSEETLIRMAGYRNRLVHFYHEVTADELFSIINKQLNDIEIFAAAIVQLMDKPNTFGLSIEE